MSDLTVVIGAGIAGLSAAMALIDAGREVLVLESGAGVGGVMRSERVEGYVIEQGPNTVEASGLQLQRLIAMAGLHDATTTTAPSASDRFIYRDGAMCKLPGKPNGLLTTSALSTAGKWRLLQEPFIARPTTVDPEETVASFCARRLGQEALDFLVNPFVSGIFAGDPARLEVASAFPTLPPLEQQYGSLLQGMRASRRAARQAGTPPAPKGLLSFREGLGMLPRAIGALLGERVRCQAPVDRIERTSAGWRIGVASDEFEACALFVATPASIAAHLLRETDVAIAAQLEAIPYAPIAVVHLGYPAAAFSRVPVGFGVLIPRNQGIATLGALFLSSLFPERAPEGHVLLTCYIGGFANPGIMERDDAALIAQVHRDLVRVLGVHRESTWQRVVRYARAIPQYVPGHAARVATIGQRVREVSRLQLAGNYLTGISVDASIGSGFAAALRVIADCR